MDAVAVAEVLHQNLARVRLEELAQLAPALRAPVDDGDAAAPARASSTPIARRRPRAQQHDWSPAGSRRWPSAARKPAPSVFSPTSSSPCGRRS